MKLKVYLICILATVSGMQLNAQDEYEWLKTYGGPATNYAYGMERMPNGDIIVGGMNQNNAQGGRDFWVARFDTAGEMLWDQNYTVPGTLMTLFGFHMAENGDALLAGFTNTQGGGDEGGIMYRIDAENGDIVWETLLDYHDSDHAHILVERREGGYFFAGHSDSYDDPSGEFWLGRLDEMGDTLWEKTYNRGIGGGAHVHAGRATPDGGFIMVGHSSQAGFRYWLVKVDSNGEVEWDRYFTHPYPQSDTYSIEVTQEGGYAIFGAALYTQSTREAWMLVLDSLGNTLVDEKFGGSANNSMAWTGRQTSSGNFIMTGYTNQNGPTNIHVIKTDNMGQLQWERIYGGPSTDRGYSIIEVEDGYYISGLASSASLGANPGGDMFLMKISRYGTPLSVNNAVSGLSMLDVSAPYPNPFAAGKETQLSFSVETASNISVNVYNINGQLISELYNAKTAGGERQTISWDATDHTNKQVSSGTYLIKVHTQNESATFPVIVR
jgi:hypothetical protein